MSSKSEKKGFVLHMLDFVESAGNKLPQPFILFAILTATVIVLSAVLSWMGVSAVHPQDPTQQIEVFNLLSPEGVASIFSSVVSNFINFPPLGLVIVMMVGIGLVEQTGLISTALRMLVMSMPRQLVTLTLVFSAIMANLAVDAGYVVLVPLGAVVFLSMGRHPIAGLAAAFAGVSGGFSANLLITPLDALLGGISESAAQTFHPDFEFNIAGNFYFMAASVVFLTLVGTWITEKIVEPRLGTYEGEYKGESYEITALEKKGLKFSGLALLVTVALLSLLVVPENAPMRGPEGTIVPSPFLTHLVPVMLIFFFVPGLVYGIVTKSITKSADVPALITKTMAGMAGFITLVFMASQFVGFFTQSNLGLIMAVSGAEFLQAIGLTGFWLILLFIILAAFINLFIGSASAKWAIMAPIFVPILMELGYTPEFTQLAYRIADSTTNVISPLMSYFALILAFAQKYDKNMKLGTLISSMVPYSVAFFIFWVALLAVWMFLDLPIGPGTGIFIQ